MEVNWEMLIQTAAQELMKIFIPVFVVLLLKWLVEIWKKLKEKNPELGSLIAYAAQLGYAAAEEYFRDMPGKTGADKMNYAISRGAEYLQNVGVYVDEDVLRDTINEYGVANFKFSWTKPTLKDLFGTEEEENPEAGLDPDETEEENEPSAAGDMRIGSVHDDHNADHQQSCEQPDGSDQESAKSEV